MKKLASTVSAALLVAVLTVGLAATGAADTKDQETEVDVEIAGVTQLDVRPSALSYSDDGGIAPGEERTSSDNDFEHVEIANIGSEEIEEIHAQATMPDANPFGDEDSDYDTGNFITVGLDTAEDGEYSDGLGPDSTFSHYLNRVEFAEDPAPTYIQTEEDGAEADTVSLSDDADEKVGRFRAGGVEYFWVLYHDGDVAENDWILRVGQAPHTSSQIGTTDFTNDGEDYEEYEGSAGDGEDGEDPGDDLDSIIRANNQDLITFDTEGDADSDYEGQNILGGEDDVLDDLENVQEREYNLFINGEDGYIVRTKFNIEQQDPLNTESRADRTQSGSQEALFSSSSSALQPGESFPVDVGVQVPQGVDSSEDAVNSGTMTFFATEQGDPIE